MKKKLTVVHYAPAKAIGNGAAVCNRFMSDDTLITGLKTDVTCKRCIKAINKK